MSAYVDPSVIPTASDLASAEAAALSIFSQRLAGAPRRVTTAGRIATLLDVIDVQRVILMQDAASDLSEGHVGWAIAQATKANAYRLIAREYQALAADALSAGDVILLHSDKGHPDIIRGGRAGSMSVEDRLLALAAELRDRRTDESAARAALADAVQEAVASGMSRYRVESITGLAQETVRKWARGER